MPVVRLTRFKARYANNYSLITDNCLYWRGARVVEWDGLENRCGGDSTEGSNPSPSASDSNRSW